LKRLLFVTVLLLLTINKYFFIALFYVFYYITSFNLFEPILPEKKKNNATAVISQASNESINKQTERDINKERDYRFFSFV
jgi:hypothetical protein